MAPFLPPGPQKLSEAGHLLEYPGHYHKFVYFQKRALTIGCSELHGQDFTGSMGIYKYVSHCFYRQPGEGIQIGPNWDLSKALNN